MTMTILMRNLLILSSLSLSFSIPQANAQPKDTNNKGTTAHVDVKLGSLSNKKLDIIVQIPSQEAYGFAGKAETPEQNAIANTVVDSLKQDISTIIYAAPTLDCKYQINKIDKFATLTNKYEEHKPEGKTKVTEEYNVLKVDLTLKCLKDLPEQNLNIDFSREFKNINRIMVDLKGKDKRKFIINNASGNFTI